MLEYISSSEKVKKSDGVLKLSDEDSKGGKVRKYILEFKAIKRGYTKVDFSDMPSVYNEEDVKMTSSYAPAYIEIQGEEDKEAHLESLRISPGKLKKAFSEKVYTYDISVENSVTEVVIDAKAKSDKATIEVSGDTDLKVGVNKVKVTVTAESGNEKEYLIKVKRLTEEEQKVYDDKKRAKERKNRVVIYEDRGKAYAENDAKYEILEIKDSDGTKIPVKYKKVKLELYGVDMEACVPENNENSDIILIYAKNTVNDYKGYYSYDKVEKTFQRYFGDTLSIAGDKSNQLFEKQEYEDNVRKLSIIVAMAIVSLIIALIVIIKLYSDIKNIKNDNYLV
jgi:hypothetical protein